MIIKKSKRSRRGISTLVATVLILAIVVSLVGIVSAWATGYLDMLLGRSGVMVTIENVEFRWNGTVVTVLNKGVSKTEIQAVFINDVEILYGPAPENQTRSYWIISVDSTEGIRTIKPDQVGRITILWIWAPKTSYTIKIVVSGFFPVTKVVTSPEKLAP